MPLLDVPVPCLSIATTGPLHPVEEAILSQTTAIEAWFRQQWHAVPAPITSSVDLRHAGFKLAPVDTNLFPAGFNNLNPDFLPLCIQAVQAVFIDSYPQCTRILLLPESHTRNRYYLKNLSVLRDILERAGFFVKVGSLDPALTSPIQYELDDYPSLTIEPIQRKGDRIVLNDFDPCLLLLNNDLSSGIPAILSGVEQSIQPNPLLGWSSRLKSNHFHAYSQVVSSFSVLLNIDPWLIYPLFESITDIDFMAQKGIEIVAEKAEHLFQGIRDKYKQHGIKERPFLAIKADNGTYGMSVMMIQDPQELIQLNRKQRTRMAMSKGGNVVDKVIIQEGVYTFETMPDGAVAEPVVYMIGPYVVGGFYRVHSSRGKNENLNSPGMHFEPLAFATPCNTPQKELTVLECPNRFYVYGVIARLAALAAGYEAIALRSPQ